MKTYFKHQLKSHSRAIIIVTVLFVLISFFVSVESMERIRRVTFIDDGEDIYNVVGGSEALQYFKNGKYVTVTDETVIEVEYRDLTLSYPATMLILLSFAVPVWVFGFMKKKRNLDCCYSLPITRRGMGIAQYLLGGIAVLVPFVASYAVMIISNVNGGLFGKIEHETLILHFLVCLLTGFALYSISCFVFDRANTVIDGIVMIGIYAFVLYFVAENLQAIINEISYFVYRAELSRVELASGAIPQVEQFYLSLRADGGISFLFFSELLGDLESDAELIYTHYARNFIDGSKNLDWLVFWSVAGLLSSFGLIYGFNKKKAETAEEISSSPFCYKLLIPIFFIMSNINYGILDNETTTCIAMTVACVVAYTVYRRGVRYKKSDYIVVGVMVLLTFCSLFVYDAITDALPREYFDGEIKII